MPKPRVLVLRAPGTNCDQETLYAFEQAGAETELIHVNRLLEKPSLGSKFQIFCMPGGFSYGDDIAAGRILASQLRNHFFEVIQQFKEDEKLVLGICNGFQILMKSGILLRETEVGPQATLTWNESGQFEDRWVNLRVDGSKSVFLDGIHSMYLPVAHAEGRFVPRDEATIKSLASSGQLVLRYGDPETNGAGLTTKLPFPANPNGSELNVAGLCDETGRVLGLMPHPERYIDHTHHPQWTRLPTRSKGDGLTIFENAVKFFD